MRLYCFLSRNRSAKPTGAARARCLRRVWPSAPCSGTLAEHCRQEALEGQLYVEECLSVWVTAREHAACNRPRARLQWMVIVSRAMETFLPLFSTYNSFNEPASSSNKSSWSLCASPCVWYLGGGHPASVYFYGGHGMMGSAVVGLVSTVRRRVSGQLAGMWNRNGMDSCLHRVCWWSGHGACWVAALAEMAISLAVRTGALHSMKPY